MKHILFVLLLSVLGCSAIACSPAASNPTTPSVPDPTEPDPIVDSGVDTSVPDASKTDTGAVDSGADTSSVPDTSVADSAPPAWQPCRGLPGDISFQGYPNNVAPFMSDPKTCSNSPNKLFRYGTCMHVTVTFDALNGHDPYQAEFYKAKEFTQICSGCAVVTGMSVSLYPVEVASGFLPWFRSNDGTPFWPDGYYTVTLDPTNDTVNCPTLADPDFVLMTSQYSYTRESRLCDRYGTLVQLTHDLVPVLPQQAWSPNDACPP